MKRQFRVIDINNIKPEDYSSFGLALMTLRLHDWKCSSIIDGRFNMTRLVEEEDNFDSDADELFEEGPVNTYNNIH